MFDTLHPISEVTVFDVEYQGSDVVATFRADHDGGSQEYENAFYAAVDYIFRAVEVAGRDRDDYRITSRREVRLGGDLRFIPRDRVDAALTDIYDSLEG